MFNIIETFKEDNSPNFAELVKNYVKSVIVNE